MAPDLLIYVRLQFDLSFFLKHAQKSILVFSQQSTIQYLEIPKHAGGVVKVETINPATGKTLAHYDLFTDFVLDQAITDADRTFREWKKTSIASRVKLCVRMADLLEKKKKEAALLITDEMGKPIVQAIAEVEKCALAFRYYAENGEGFLQRKVVKTEHYKSFITYNPLGCILGVMPWNFPFWQVMRFAAPTTLAGNVVLVKHASNVYGCSAYLENLFLEAGYPAHVFTNLFVNHDGVARALADRRIQAVSLTGSTQAGRTIASQAGKHIKKSLLELGGSDPYLVLKDADIDHAVDVCVKARLLNSGQSCISAKRFIIENEVYDSFVDKFVTAMAQQKVGDPRLEDTDIGPLARYELRDELHRQVERSLKKGARLLLGGVTPKEKGAYYPPTVLVDVKPGMPAFDEELFGPVAAVIKARDEEEAIHLANETVYGLGAAVFTNDLEKGERIAVEELAAGACSVNGNVRSDPRLPFGGIKESGYGRELSEHGIHEFVNIHSVAINPV